LRLAHFAGLWLFIACVSVHDGYLVALNRAVILETELNPLGRQLLLAAEGEVWGLLAAKTVGTVLACSLLLLLFWHSRRLGSVVAASLAMFQLGLLLFLTLT
jgi:hypothetical protein